MKKFTLLSVILIVVLVASSFTILGAENEDLGSWDTRSAMPVPCTAMGIAEVDGKIYVIGGLSVDYEIVNTVRQYDPDTDTWTEKTSMPTPRRDLGIVTVNEKIYAIGGYYGGLKATVEEYDPLTDTWTTKASMPTAREALGVGEVNGKIYAIGGSNTATVEEYDPVTDTWTTKASMPTARDYVGVKGVNGKIYAIGGLPNTAVVEEYDPATDIWTTKASMPTARYGVIVEEAYGKIYAIGGKGGVDHLTTVEEYNPVTDTWTTKANMPTARGGGGVAKVDGNVYVIGGYSKTDGILGIVEVFTPPSINVTSPTSLTATPSQDFITLNWDSIPDADSYIIARTTTSSVIDTVIATNITDSTYIDTDVEPGITYYYVVRAVKYGIESKDSNIASAMIEQSNNKALLLIKLVDENDKEYDLSMDEVNAFIDWYYDRGDGQGSAYYVFEKDYNVGPYVSRKDYIAHDKIIYFEVNEYIAE